MALWVVPSQQARADPREAHAAAPERLPAETLRQVQALQARARRHLRLGELDQAQQALTEALELAPGERSLYADLSEVYRRRDDPGADSGASTRKRKGPARTPVRPTAGAKPALSTQPTAGDRPSPSTQPTAGASPAPSGSGALAWLDPSILGEQPVEVGLLAAAALAALLCVALLARALLHRTGELSVVLDLPPERSGHFTVKLLKARPPFRRLPSDFHPEDRPSTDTEHYQVARETLFRSVPARDWWVTLEGRTDEGEVIARELEVRVVRGRAARIVFDLAPEVCTVEVRLLLGGRAVRGHVAVEGDPDSLRLAKKGVARLRVKLGHHGVLAGAADRAAEKTIEVKSFETRTLIFDLDDEASLVFRDCEAAVEPFLRGDLSVAASALGKAGQKERAALLAARFHRQAGDLAEAARRFTEAGRLLEAAELWAEHGGFEKAARLFERAGDLERAAEMYNAEGDLLRAGRAYMDAGDFDAAIICYREAGEVPALIDVLEKKGEFYEAGRLATERGDSDRAIRNFQRVAAQEESYFHACRILAEAFQKQGKDELAIQKADEALSVCGAEALTSRLRIWHADLLGRAGRPDRGVKLLEELRSESPEDVPGLATRIETMRRRAAELSSSAGSLGLRAKPFGDASRYTLHEQIGSGGMGVVYRATDRRLDREVALKRLPENLKDHPRAVELFLHEARASARLNHPNIVTVHDVDMEGGIYFITMELLRGANLLQLVRGRGALSWSDAARLAVQTCSGLGHAHEQGIVHRDIKSANLFFTDDRIVKIMDFGLAKMAAEVRRTSTVAGGTPYYMAPEQGSGGEDVDRRVDLYSLGVTLFELVTGHRPFEKGDIAEQHRRTPAPDPRIHGIQAPDAFVELVLQLLAKCPDDRPQSAQQVATRLRRMLG